MGEPGRSVNGEAAARLLAEQLDVWPDLAAGHTHLARALVAEWAVEGWKVKVQCNPGRVRSNRAQVDAAAIAARPCFLCPANRPEAQRELEWGEAWWILANPAPIFPAHFTVVYRPHGPRQVVEMLEDMLALSRDLSPGLSLFYNGPRSGASAPDHFHFQAYTRGELPTEEELLGGEPRSDILGSVNLGGVTGRVHAAAGRGVLELRDTAGERLAEALRRAVAALPADQGREPDLNLICRWVDGEWRVALFPRLAHRPACYFAAEGERILVSPGAADMAGLVVVTREEDLARLNGSVLRGIYGEVAMGGEALLAHLAAGGGA